jgi:hypothetical protein
MGSFPGMCLRGGEMAGFGRSQNVFFHLTTLRAMRDFGPPPTSLKTAPKDRQLAQKSAASTKGHTAVTLYLKKRYELAAGSPEPRSPPRAGAVAGDPPGT